MLEHRHQAQSEEADNADQRQCGQGEADAEPRHQAAGEEELQQQRQAVHPQVDAGEVHGLRRLAVDRVVRVERLVREQPAVLEAGVGVDVLPVRDIDDDGRIGREIEEGSSKVSGGQAWRQG